MIIPIPSGHQRFQLTLGIRARAPFELGVRAHDPSRSNTDYIRRCVPFNTQQFRRGERSREIVLAFPVSPDHLLLELYDKNTGADNGFTLERFQLQELAPATIWEEPVMHRFVSFAQDFSQRAGFLPYGLYDSPDGDFLIQYLPSIQDVPGVPLVTPARTNRKTGRIQVNRPAFASYTIPVRLVVLLHERYHFHIPTRLEKPADLHALKLYLDLGYPRIEAVYATSKIFSAHPDTVGPAHVSRVAENMRFIDWYTEQLNAKTNPTA